MPSGRGAERRAASEHASSSQVAQEANQEQQETQRWDVQQAFSHQGSGRMLVVLIYKDLNNKVVSTPVSTNLCHICPFEISGPSMIYQNI